MFSSMMSFGRLTDRVTVNEFVCVCVYLCIGTYILLCIEFLYVGSNLYVSVCVCCGASGINIIAVTHFCCSVAFALSYSFSLCLSPVPLLTVELLCWCCCCFFVFFSSLHNTNTNALGRYISPFVMLIVKTTH